MRSALLGRDDTTDRWTEIIDRLSLGAVQSKPNRWTALDCFTMSSEKAAASVTYLKKKSAADIDKKKDKNWNKKQL